MEVGIVHTNLGSLRDSAHDFEGAIAEQRIAIAVFEHALGPTHTRTLNTSQRLGDSLSKAKHYDEAATILMRTTQQLTDSLGANHPYVANGHFFLGQHYRRVKRLDDAVAEFNAAERATIGSQGAAAKSLTRVYSALGETYEDLGRTADAARSYEAALAHIGDDATGGSQRADLEFSLAGVLAAGPSADRARAHELATSARARFAALGAKHADDLAEVEAWLAKHFPKGS